MQNCEVATVCEAFELPNDDFSKELYSILMSSDMRPRLRSVLVRHGRLCDSIGLRTGKFSEDVYFMLMSPALRPRLKTLAARHNLSSLQLRTAVLVCMDRFAASLQESHGQWGLQGLLAFQQDNDGPVLSATSFKCGSVAGVRDNDCLADLSLHKTTALL